MSTSPIVPRGRGGISKRHDDKGDLVPVPPQVFLPSTSWDDCGPFIEREHIDLVSDFGRWMARHGQRNDNSRSDVSPLVAARRRSSPLVAARRRDARLPHAGIRDDELLRLAR
jgi:hypothetical protein